jgi:hypothetical protein
MNLPVVSRNASYRPGVPDWTEQGCTRVPIHRCEHGRGKSPRDPEKEESPHLPSESLFRPVD